MTMRSFDDALRRRKGLFAEKRVFLKTGDETRFVRLRARDQVLAWTGGLLMVGWTLTATALLTVQFVQGHESREQAAADRMVYEQRVQVLASERDQRHTEALAAQEQFASLLSRLSGLQERIFDAELTASEKSEEAESLRDQLRDARTDLAAASRQLAALPADGSAPAGSPDAALSLMTAAMADMAHEREELAADLEEARTEIADMKLETKIAAARNDRIFRQLEEAVTVSLRPMDKMFARLGVDSDAVLDTLRDRSGGQGGPLTPISLSTKGEIDPETGRANNILSHMQELNLYRMAINALPMAVPVDMKSNVHQTSGFGYRRDPMGRGTRMHEGVDFSGEYGTPVLATADGVVIHAGWQSGYGRLIKIQHEFGIETRYAHLASLSVKVGQRVSRGDRIGAMGNSGRSTGTHLHYEVRLGGKATDPMTYLTAARDVF